MTQMPPSYPPNMYQQPPQQEAPGATTALVLGIIVIVVNIPIVGLIMAYIGFQKAKAARELCRANPGRFSNAGVAEAGYVVCIIALVLGALGSFCVCAYFGFIGLMFLVAGAGAAGGGMGP